MTEITVLEAQKVVDVAQKKRMNRCKAELDSLLETHNCQLQVQLSISVDGRVVGSVRLVERTA